MVNRAAMEPLRSFWHPPIANLSQVARNGQGREQTVPRSCDQIPTAVGPLTKELLNTPASDLSSKRPNHRLDGKQERVHRLPLFAEAQPCGIPRASSYLH